MAKKNRTSSYETLFELVNTPKQQRQFEKTWEYFCDEFGWINDPYAENGVRYNLLIKEMGGFKRRRVIGTIEFTPYHPKNPNSTVEGPHKFPFSECDEIKANQERIWEIDKLCIHQDYQRRGYFYLFMHIFQDHTSRYNPKYYLALMEKRFFRMLRISFGLPVVQRGDALVCPTTALIPILFDVEEMLDDDKKVMSLLTMTTRQQPPKNKNIKNLMLKRTNTLTPSKLFNVQLWRNFLIRNFKRFIIPKSR